MFILVMCLWGALLFAKLFPETPTGRRLHEVLVEAPARWISGRRAKRLFWTFVLVALLSLALSRGFPPVALPLDSLIATLEANSLLDVAAALGALSAGAMLSQGRAVWSACRSLLAQARRRLAFARPRARSGRRCPARQAATRSSPADDGEPGRPWAFALA
jgi:hypothetical protein